MLRAFLVSSGCTGTVSPNTARDVSWEGGIGATVFCDMIHDMLSPIQFTPALWSCLSLIPDMLFFLLGFHYSRTLKWEDFFFSLYCYVVPFRNNVNLHLFKCFTLFIVHVCICTHAYIHICIYLHTYVSNI